MAGSIRFRLYVVRPRIHRVGAPDTRVAWRLLSGNNIEIARSAGSFTAGSVNQASVDCAVHAAGIALNAGTLRGRLSTDETGLWHWQLADHSGAQVISARGYSRESECRRAVRYAVEVLGTAGIQSAVDGPSGRSRVRRDRLDLPEIVTAFEQAGGSAWPADHAVR